MHDNDEMWMEQAIKLADKGRFTAHPNPRVGCIIVKDGQIVGSGWHVTPGKHHAESMALIEAGTRANGATCYVNLEPCQHHGRTPPCAQALVNAGVKRVVVAHADPNPLARGGSKYLASHGIDVTIGTLRTSARHLNRGFFKRFETGLPFAVAKMAVTVDARTALSNGESKWITSEPAREKVHQLRAQSGAIVTGIGTVLKDDPRMDVRLWARDNPMPLRVILDTQGKLPANARILEAPGKIIQMVAPGVVVSPHHNKTVVEIPLRGGRLDLQTCWRYLAEAEINDVLLEGGATLLGAAIQAHLVDELVLYMAPKLFGHCAHPLAFLPDIEKIEDHQELQWTSVRTVGPDVELTAKFL